MPTLPEAFSKLPKPSEDPPRCYAELLDLMRVVPDYFCLTESGTTGDSPWNSWTTSDKDDNFLEDIARSFASVGAILFVDPEVVGSMTPRLSPSTSALLSANLIPVGDLRQSLDDLWETVELWIAIPILRAKIQSSLVVYLALFLQVDHLETKDKDSPIARIKNVRRLRRFLRQFPLTSIAESCFVLSKLYLSRHRRMERKSLGKNPRLKGWFPSVLADVLTRILGEENGVEAVLSAIYEGVPPAELEQWTTGGRLAVLLTTVPVEFRSKRSTWYNLVVPQLVSICSSIEKFPRFPVERITLESLAVMVRSDPVACQTVVDDHVFLSLISITSKLGDTTAFSDGARDVINLLKMESTVEHLQLIGRLLTKGISPLTSDVTDLFSKLVDALAFIIFHSAFSADLGIQDTVRDLVAIILRSVDFNRRTGFLLDAYVNALERPCRILYADGGRNALTDEELLSCVISMCESTGNIWGNLCFGENVDVLKTTGGSKMMDPFIGAIAKRLLKLSHELSIFSSISLSEKALHDLFGLAILYRNLLEPLLDAEDDSSMERVVKSEPGLLNDLFPLPAKILTLLPKIDNEQFRTIPFTVYLLTVKFVGKATVVMGPDALKGVDNPSAMELFLLQCCQTEDVKPYFGDLAASVSWREYVEGMQIMIVACELALQFPLYPDSGSESSRTSEFQSALEDTKDGLLPVRAGAYQRLRRLLDAGGPDANCEGDLIFFRCTDGLSSETDSYVYLSIIQCLEALVFSDVKQMLPRLLSVFAELPVSAGNLSPSRLSPDVRSLYGETVVRVTRRLGPIAPHYAGLLFNTVLCLIRDVCADVRTTALSALAEIVKSVGFGITSVRREVLYCLKAVYETDESLLNRRAAIYTLGEVISGLGKDFAEVYGDCSRSIWKLLKNAADDTDDVTRQHAERALENLDSLPRLMASSRDSMMPIISQRSLKKL